MYLSFSKTLQLHVYYSYLSFNLLIPFTMYIMAKSQLRR